MYYGNEAFTQGGGSGLLEEFDWDGNLVWSYVHSTDLTVSHHDVEVLPNGNVLMLVWDWVSADDALAVGRDPAKLSADGVLTERVIEVDPDTDEVVWEWSAWDHLVQDFDETAPEYAAPSSRPERLNINQVNNQNPQNMDWLHFNSVAYNAGLDQIALSASFHSEVWIIDHSTTTEEAATSSGGASGAGGDLLYRWGNPEVYGGPTEGVYKIRFLHDPHWIAPGLPGEGNLIIFDNNGADTGSAVLEVVPPLNEDGTYDMTDGAWGPDQPVWSYAADGFHGRFISGAERLAGGNTMISEGPAGRIFEVTAEGEIVWEYEVPVGTDGPLTQGTEPAPLFGAADENLLFRAERCESSHPGLTGRDLTPQGGIELEP